jgi:hypothetical protein
VTDTADRQPGRLQNDGRASTLVIAGADGSVRTWDLRVETWLAKACQMAGRGLTQEEWRTYLPDRAYRDPCRART